MSEWVTVAKMDEVPEGEMIGTEVDGAALLVANVGGEYRAIGSVCTHAEGPLHEGELEDRTVTCPWHGSVFDLETGEASGPPATEPVPVYQVRVEGDEIQVAKPAA